MFFQGFQKLFGKKEAEPQKPSEPAVPERQPPVENPVEETLSAASGEKPPAETAVAVQEPPSSPPLQENISPAEEEGAGLAREDTALPIEAPEPLPGENAEDLFDSALAIGDSLSSEEEETATAIAEQPREGGFFSGFRAAVSMTGKSLVGKIFGLVQDDPITDDMIDEIEEILIRADVGLDTATDIADKLRDRKSEFSGSEKLMNFLKQEFSDILSPYEAANQLVYKQGAMNVYLVVGVNGAGKTTFIGKLAHRFMQQGKKVMIGAGDTFRAAAEEQLEIWAQRSGAGFVGAGTSKDPAAVIFEALKQGRENGADVVLLDTAGRLQNKYNLMEELRKIRKVIDQGMPEGAHFESLLVLDATTGQNALKQAEVFKEAVDISGVVLTKLDGSAKGGVILTIAKEYKLPVKMVGTGEKIEDLKDFSAREFVDALFAR